MVMKYQKGEDNIADYLSRHPCKNTEYCSLAEEYVKFMTDTSKPIALSISKLIFETIRDDLLQSVIKLVNTNKWKLVTEYNRLRTFVINLLLQMMACYCVNKISYS